MPQDGSRRAPETGWAGVLVDILDTKRGDRSVLTLRALPARIGRHPESDVCLRSAFIAPEQAVLHREAGGLHLRGQGLNPCLVDDVPVGNGRSVPLTSGSAVRVGEYVLRFRELGPAGPAAGAAAWRDGAFEVVREIHTELIRRTEAARRPLADGEGRGAREAVAAELDRVIDGLLPRAADETLLALATAALYARMVARAMGADAPGTGASASAGVREVDDWLERTERELGARAGEDTVDLLDRLERHGDALLPATAGRIDRALRVAMARDFLREELQAIVFGHGPLDRLLRRGDVTEIMVVGPQRIFVERGGRLELTGSRFLSRQNLVDVIQRMVAPMGRRVDRSSPLVDGRLPAGYRLNAVIDPVAVAGPYLTIRKFPERPFTIDDLISRRSLTPAAAAFVAACVRARKNVLVAGGTGSGKTTLLNVLASFIGPRERVVTIEDAAELRLQQEHVVTLETRPPNLEGAGEIGIRDLVRNALRMRPDRIIVGECRGAEAVDMLQAMNTGHAGSMTTLHANSAAEAVRRLEVMVLGALDIPLAAAREQIAGALDVVVHIGRLPGGERRVLQVSEVAGTDPDTSDVLLTDIFRVGRDAGDLEHTGRMPTFAHDLVRLGLLAPEAFLGGGVAP